MDCRRWGGIYCLGLLSLSCKVILALGVFLGFHDIMTGGNIAGGGKDTTVSAAWRNFDSSMYLLQVYAAKLHSYFLKGSSILFPSVR